MSLPIKLVCKKSKTRKDGTSVVFIQYCQSSDKRILLNTGVAIPPNYWNRKSNSVSNDLPVQYGRPEDLQHVLIEKLRKIEDIIMQSRKENIVCSIDYIKRIFYTSGNTSSNIETVTQEKGTDNDLYKQIDLFIDSKKMMVKPRSLKVYYALKKHLQAFEKYRKLAITLNSFDAEFFDSFANFLSYKIHHSHKKEVIEGFKKNTVAKTIKRLKVFLRDMIRKKVIPYIDLSFYKTEEEAVDNVYLTENEISKIYHLDLSEYSYLEKYRDLFVLGCLTGLRFSDYATITADEIKDDMLYIHQTKTLSQVIIPLRKEAKEILIKKYQLNIPQVSNQNFNYYIKEIAQIARINQAIKITYKKGNRVIEEIRPKYAWVSSHTCRRSFCTNEFIAGTPTELIMAISGHKSESSFKKYIKADQFQKAQLIKKIWERRNML
jgi:Site-specific recombinase XerD